MLKPLTALVVVAWCAGGPAAAEPMAVRGVHVVNVADGTNSREQTIVCDAGRIVWVGPDAGALLPPGTRIEEAPGAYAIPGLWDMHVHLYADPEHLAPLFIANGVTSVRDMGGPYEEVFRLRVAIAEGTAVGPRIFSPGPILESSRWIERAKGFLPAREMGARIPIASADDADRVIGEVLALGADFIKIRTVESADVYFALAAAAKARGTSLVGHAPPPAVDLIAAAQAGQRSFEHYVRGPGVRPLPEDLTAALDAFKKAGVLFVPTLVSGIGFRLTPDDRTDAVLADAGGVLEPRRRYVPKALLESWRAQIELKRTERTRQDWARIHADNLAVFKAMHQSGVSLMVGTDLAAPLVYPGSSTHDELALFVDELGFTPAEALRAATQVPAQFMNKPGLTGTIAAGSSADFVLLDKDPLQDIRNTTSIRAVVGMGRYYSRTELDALLDAAAANADY